MKETKGPAWDFRIYLEGELGELLERKVADDLLDAISTWADGRGFQVEGQVRKPEPVPDVPFPEVDED